MKDLKVATAQFENKSGNTFARHLSKEQMLEISELIPEGKSIAKAHQLVVMAGLFEKDNDDNIFKAYVVVDKNGLIAKHRKLHPFINPNILPGNEYTIFDLNGWTCGILICYDNNIIENVRATTLLGADVRGCVKTETLKIKKNNGGLYDA